jgi:hypothetical protein
LKFTITISLFLISCIISHGQEDSTDHRLDSLPDRFYVIQKVDRGGETMPEIEIKEVNIHGRRKLSERFAYWRYQRLVYNVKRVYPYAVLVRVRLGEVDSQLKELPDDRERRKYIRDFEKQVFHDYEGDMRQMTITQGRLLIKLIDRETQNTSYDLIRDYRGKLSAGFWQAVARIFGSNLKDEYDPEGEDATIEKIIREIEAGRL